MRIKKVLLVLVATLIVAVSVISVQIYTYAGNVANVQADAAIVLGAALWGKDLSPVFRERVNHAIQLYRSRKVRKIIFTGAQGSQNEPSESAAARRYAIEKVCRKKIF
jgi:vancomycin permeability regulator SanA